MGSGDPLVDVPNPGFTWIPKGQSITYLGCRVGLELNVEDNIALLLLLLRLRNKLIYWNKEKLSLVGSVVAADSTFLSSS